jgi:hypothetical protein
MSRLNIWDRVASERIAAQCRGTLGMASALGFLVGLGLIYAIAPAMGRVLGG